MIKLLKCSGIIITSVLITISITGIFLKDYFSHVNLLLKWKWGYIFEKDLHPWATSPLKTVDWIYIYIKKYFSSFQSNMQ